MKAFFYTLGCKVNQYESQEIKELFKKNKYEITNQPEKADVIVVNSCTVTNESNRKTRQALRRFKQANPLAAIVLTGCIPQAFPKQAIVINEADIVLGNKNNANIVEAVNNYLESHNRIINIKTHESKEKYSGTGITHFEGHTRAFLKIQDGCNRFCSYCIIPFARGESRSKPISEIENELVYLGKNNYLEVVYTGINLSSYGRDFGIDLTTAVKLAEKSKKIKRIRLSSLEPDHIDYKMIEALSKISIFCPHFHISLQSGNDSVLNRMNRHYSTQDYLEIVDSIRKKFDNAAISTDIIVGFPGETQEEFSQTLDFVKMIGFSKVHIFPFSERKGTKAADMPNKLTKAIKTERCKELLALCDMTRKDFLNKHIGKTEEVLFESPKNDVFYGLAKNSLPVKASSIKNITGKILPVRIISVDGDFCLGKIIESNS